MIEPDTIKLLRECDAGIKMGISSIEEVLDRVTSSRMQQMLLQSKQQHEQLKLQCQGQLRRFDDQGKNPDPVARGMSWVKTEVKMATDKSDATIAELMIDGCDMGVKSLSRYLNQYPAADRQSKELAKALIQREEQLSTDLRCYL